MNPPAAGHHAGSTSEQIWADWLPNQPWPSWSPDPSWQRVAICAAHPDDEVLGVGGTIAALAAAGVQLHLIAVTDGEASHPGSAVLGPTALAGVRISETERSLAALGVGAVRTTRLGLPDGAVAAQADQLAAAVTGAVAGCDAVLTTWARDGHPDHEAVGRAAVTAGARLGVPAWQYPVWAWHWAVPGDARVPWQRAHRVELSAAGLVSKRAAIGCHASQIVPLGPQPADAAVLPPEFLAHFDRRYEVLWT